MASRRSITLQGMLLRDGSGFVLRPDGGGQMRLDLLRTPVDHVEKRVRITGVLLDDERIEVETILPLDR